MLVIDWSYKPHLKTIFLISFALSANWATGSEFSEKNKSGLNSAMLVQEERKLEHRERSPYSKYILLTLNKNSAGVSKGINIYPGEDDSLFREAGFLGGDVILSVDDKSVIDEESANYIIEKLYRGEKITAKIENGGKIRTLLIDLKALESKAK